jgi:hypothetical protein
VWQVYPEPAVEEQDVRPVAGARRRVSLELKALLARLDYRINDHFAAGLSYRWEDYTIDSFILQGLRNYLPGALLLNGNNGNYKASVYGVSFSLFY